LRSDRLYYANVGAYRKEETKKLRVEVYRVPTQF